MLWEGNTQGEPDAMTYTLLTAYIAANVEVVHIEVRRTTLPRKLRLKFHLVRLKGNVAHCTGGADPWTMPQPVRVAIRELALFDGFASFTRRRGSSGIG